jgi:hypothetical protein
MLCPNNKGDSEEKNVKNKPGRKDDEKVTIQAAKEAGKGMQKERRKSVLPLRSWISLRLAPFPRLEWA